MDTKIITALHRVLDAVVDEAENNEDFAGKLERAFTGNSSSPVKKRKVHRRQKPVLNPLDMIEDMHALDAKLHTLSVDQLKDIVSVYSMDLAVAQAGSFDRADPGGIAKEACQGKCFPRINGKGSAGIISYRLQQILRLSPTHPMPPLDFMAFRVIIWARNHWRQRRHV